MSASTRLCSIVRETSLYRFVLARVTAAVVLSLSALTFGTEPAGALEFSVQNISVSPGGMVVGTHAFIPVGGTVTIGARVADVASAPVLATGASYYGWDSNILSFVSGNAVDSIFHDTRVPGSGGVGGVLNRVPDPLIETSAGLGGPFGGTPNVRMLAEISYLPAMALAGDSGLDGVCGGGDAQFRATFAAVSEGETTLVIGTGDDGNGIIVLPGSVAQATNATVMVTVPEPSFAGSIAAGLFFLVALGKARTSLGDEPRPAAKSAHHAIAALR